MIKKTIYLLMILGIVFISACDREDVDTTAPTIEILQPQDHAEFEPGDVIQLRAILRDNIELRSYKVEIHINDDDHTHGRVLDTGQPWTYFFAAEIERGQREYHLSLDIEIDDHAAHGEYHIGVFCADASGNESVEFIEIDVEDDH
jgi:hypothetical protein